MDLPIPSYLNIEKFFIEITAPKEKKKTESIEGIEISQYPPNHNKNNTETNAIFALLQNHELP